MTGPLDFVPDGAPAEDPESAATLGYANAPPSALKGIGAMYDENSLLGMTQRAGERAKFMPVTAAPSRVPLNEMPKQIVTPMMSADEANKQYAPMGDDGKPISITDQPIPEGVAKLVGQEKTDQINRESVIARFQNAHSWPVNFAAGTAAFMLDPVNAATAFVPGVGEETILANLGRVGFEGFAARTVARLGAGAVSGAAQQAPLSIARYAFGTQEASDYSLRDAFRDMLYGAAGNAILHAGFGGVGDFLKARRNANLGSRVLRGDTDIVPPAGPPGAPPGGSAGPLFADATKVGTVDPLTNAAAARAAVGQMVEGKPVDVMAVVQPDGTASTEPPGLLYAGMPSEASRAADAGGPEVTSPTVAPPGTQALPDQVSTRPAPSESLTTRETPPSTTVGPNTTFSDFVLGSMDASSNRKVIQGSGDLEQLASTARDILPRFQAALGAVLQDIDGAELIGARAKDIAGLREKAVLRPPQTISDYVGARIAVDTPQAMQRVLDRLGSNAKPLEVENFLANGKNGYRGVHVQMDLGNGMSAEIQLVPREISAATKLAHKLRQPWKRAVELDPKAMAAAEADFVKVRAIYDAAWAKIADRWSETSSPVPAEIPAKIVSNDKAVLPSGREIEVQYAVVEAKDLTASQRPDFSPNPRYPQELQPRDRTRSASAVQVDNIAANMNPRLLVDSPTAADGAPIIGPDGVVESGNGRVLAINRAYSEGMPTAKAYREYLASRGYPVDGMTNPVLVRIRQEPMGMADRAQFAREANERTTLGFSKSEQALSDSRAMADDVLSLHKGGDIGLAGNRDFVRAFIREVVGENDRAAMLTADGGLSSDGRRRIEAAMLARAYDDPGIIQALLDEPENNIKALGTAITNAAPQWAIMRAEARNGTINPAVDISKNLIDAINLVRQARKEGQKIRDYVTQDDMFGGAIDPVTEAVLRMFFQAEDKAKGIEPFTRPRGGDKIADVLKAYIEEARKSKAGPGLFGENDVIGPRQIIQGVTGREVGPEPEPSLFERARAAGDGAGAGGGTDGGGPGGQRPIGGEGGQRAAAEGAPGGVAGSGGEPGRPATGSERAAADGGRSTQSGPAATPAITPAGLADQQKLLYDNGFSAGIPQPELDAVSAQMYPKEPVEGVSKQTGAPGSPEARTEAGAETELDRRLADAEATLAAAQERGEPLSKEDATELNRTAEAMKSADMVEGAAQEAAACLAAGSGS